MNIIKYYHYGLYSLNIKVTGRLHTVYRILVGYGKTKIISTCT